MTNPIGPQRATPASPAKIQAEVDQARRAMEESLKVGDAVVHVIHGTKFRLLDSRDVYDAQAAVNLGGWTKLETKGGDA